MAPAAAAIVGLRPDPVPERLLYGAPLSPRETAPQNLSYPAEALSKARIPPRPASAAQARGKAVTMPGAAAAALNVRSRIPDPQAVPLSQRAPTLVGRNAHFALPQRSPRGYVARRPTSGRQAPRPRSTVARLASFSAAETAGPRFGARHPFFAARNAAMALFEPEDDAPPSFFRPPPASPGGRRSAIASSKQQQQQQPQLAAAVLQQLHGATAKLPPPRIPPPPPPPAPSVTWRQAPEEPHSNSGGDAAAGPPPQPPPVAAPAAAAIVPGLAFASAEQHRPLSARPGMESATRPLSARPTSARPMSARPTVGAASNDVGAAASRCESDVARLPAADLAWAEEEEEEEEEEEGERGDEEYDAFDEDAYEGYGYWQHEQQQQQHQQQQEQHQQQEEEEEEETAGKAEREPTPPPRPRATSGTVTGTGTAGVGTLEELAAALARATLLSETHPAILRKLAEQGEVRFLRRYITTSAFTYGGLAVLVDGCLIRMDASDAQPRPPNAAGSGAAAAQAAAPGGDGGGSGGGAGEGGAPSAGPSAFGGERRLFSGSILNEEALFHLMGGEGRSCGRFQALHASRVLWVPAEAVSALVESGELRTESEQARAHVLTRYLRNLASTVFRGLPVSTLHALAPLFDVRHVVTAEVVTPPDVPEALVIVVDGCVESTNAKTGGKARHTPASSCCWCNEGPLLGRKLGAASAFSLGGGGGAASSAHVPPVALEPSTVVLVTPEHFPQLKAALPHFVAAAGSPALMALSDVMVLAKSVDKGPVYQGRHFKADKPDRSVAVIERWERLTRLLLPFRGEGSAGRTLSFRVEDYPVPPPPREQDGFRFGSARAAGLGVSVTASADERRRAKRDAQGWRSVNRELKNH